MRVENRKTCDLIMKGGIASGLVFPGAVAELSKTFTFCQIGGSSAGAVASAMTAAAEYRRYREPHKHAALHPVFSQLSDAVQQLSRSVRDGRHSQLVDLFQAPRARQPLLSLALMLAQKDPSLGPCTILAWHLRHWHTLKSATLGALVAGVGASGCLYVAVHSTALGALSAVLGLGGCASIYAYGVYRALRQQVAALSQEAAQFGLCSGKSDAHPSDPEDRAAPGLCIWLHEQLQSLAGRDYHDCPLTLGDLQAVSPDSSQPLTLRTMTAALNLGRPYMLPFRPEDEGHVGRESGFFFDPQEWRRLFPQHVVDFLCQGQACVDLSDGRALYPFPERKRLPLLVMARMSLSFPILLAAIPLWRKLRVNVNRRAPSWERVWFSDGGLCNNFPIHMFDRMLPRRPTFAIDLEYVDPSRFDGSLPEQALRVWMPSSHDQHDLLPRWHSTYSVQKGRDSLGGFATALRNTLQHWQDSSHASVPGYRERVARVRLKAGVEGGLRFDVSAEQMRALSGYGVQAAEALNQRYGTPILGHEKQPPNWGDQRWTRLRNGFAATQRMLHKVRVTYKENDVGYPKLVSERADKRYRGPHAWQDPAIHNRKLSATLQALEQMLSELDVCATGRSRNDRPVQPSAKAQVQREL